MEGFFTFTTLSLKDSELSFIAVWLLINNSILCFQDYPYLPRSSSATSLVEIKPG